MYELLQSRVFPNDENKLKAKLKTKIMSWKLWILGNVL